MAAPMQRRVLSHAWDRRRVKLAFSLNVFSLISTQKGWASEALVYNQLAQEWAHLEDTATGVDPLARLGEPAQGSLALAGGRTG
jgi:hypothetical protein